MSMGYAKWMMKLEGKVDPKVKQQTKYYHCFPKTISSITHLRIVIREVIANGVGRLNTSRDHYPDVDTAFLWHTHPLEEQWGCLYEENEVYPEVYESCLWMKENWGEFHLTENEDYHWVDEIDW